MADVSPSVVYFSPGAVRVLWEGLSGGSSATGKKVSLEGGGSSLTFHGTGTNWSSLSLSLQGSNDGTNFITLSTPTGGAATLTANGLMEIAQQPLYVKIATTTGDTAADVDVILVQRCW